MTDLDDCLQIIDFNTVCRICLENEGTVPLFSGKSSEKDYTVQERIMSFAYVEILEGDGLPSQICKKCHLQINKAFKLKAQCEYADAMLRQCYSALEDSATDDVVKDTPVVQDAEEFLISLEADEIHSDEPTSERNDDENENQVNEDQAIRPSPDKSDPSDDVISYDVISDTVQVDEVDKNNIPSRILVENNIPVTPIIVINGNNLEVVENREDLQSRTSRKQPTKRPTQNLIKRKKQRVRPHKCTVCEEEFELEGSLVYHFKKHEPSGEYPCFDCGRIFPHEILLQIHAKSHTAARPFCCAHCGKCFMCKSTLLSHERYHFNHKSYLCSHCGKVFASKQGHICPVLHGAEREREYECSICRKKFMRKATLVTHRKRHMLLNKYRCKTCDKQFFTSQELLRHTRVHLGIRPFACSFSDCDHSFYTQGELNRHLRYHRGEKKFQCDICDQSFFESGHLANHRRKHTGERPFVCHICQKSFADCSKLKRHINIHSGTSRQNVKKGSRQYSGSDNLPPSDDKYNQSLERALAILRGETMEEQDSDEYEADTS